MVLGDVLDLGFDRSDSDGTHVSVKCSQCAALVINGTPCHERGCPNRTKECAECETRIPHYRHLCDGCANPEPDEDATECAECGGPLWGDTCDPWHCGADAPDTESDEDACPECGGRMWLGTCVDRGARCGPAGEE